jgi:hypothetical protein
LSDYRTSDEVKVEEFCLFNRYKELCRPFLGYFFHVLLCEFVIGLDIFLVFVPMHKFLSAQNFASGLNLCKVFDVMRGKYSMVLFNYK